jgi:multidrug efflux pump subunit AcrA (membrane-fusion protein)
LETVSAELRAFDAVSRVKRFDISLEMRAPARLESPSLGVALFHRDQSRLIEAGEAAVFSPASRADSAGITVHASDQPLERWDDATDLVRFRVDPGARLFPNETGWVKFATRIRRDLVIRASAVRESPQGPYVLVASNDRHLLRNRPVELGSRLYDYAAVISGLNEGEYVVAKHAFALDVERRFGSEAP